jgi:hypothetical protein
MRLIAFAARCQRVDIRTQYLKYGVRCFDLRIRYEENGRLILAHGIVEYDYSFTTILDDLIWLDGKGDCYVRVILEVRNYSQYTYMNFINFKIHCASFEKTFQHTRFWCGRNLYNWEQNYFFGDDPSCEETYGSVVPGKKWLYGWWPWLYAVTHNKAIKARGTDEDILLIDYVDI